MLIIIWQNNRNLDLTKKPEILSEETLKQTFKSHTQEALFWAQPEENEELLASWADEWFRTQPNTFYEYLPKIWFEFDKKVIIQNKVYNQVGITNINNFRNNYEIANSEWDISSTPSLVDSNYRNFAFDYNRDGLIKMDSWQSNLTIENPDVWKTHTLQNANLSNIRLSDDVKEIKGPVEDTPTRRKKNRVLTLNESRRKLALRADVMNKNFFRALRREVKSLFDDFILSNQFSMSRSKRNFRSNLIKYSNHLLEENSEDEEESKGKIY